ncbi:hypothetical protein R8Z50_22025 [Longispora sp. K20-0274]|uniref:hypothetical protein n=1 Tax=Longispora sp. K20-0274 TaxID=3088255 RepID=UPI00399B1D06
MTVATRWFVGLLATLSMIFTTAPAAMAADPGADASGGGCWTNSGARPCLSYRGSTRSLVTDFYVLSWNGVAPSGTATVWVVVDGWDYRRMGTVCTASLGHYGAWSTGVGASGSAWVEVDFFTPSGSWLMTAYSPDQYWP